MDNKTGNDENKNIKTSVVLIILIISIFVSMIFIKDIIFPKQDNADAYSILLKIGDNYLLNNDEKEFNWVSSDETIASVDKKGNVIGSGEGIVTITAYDNENKVYEYVIKVVNDNTTSLTLKEREITLQINGTHKLSVYVEPKDYDISKLTWTSSDNEVVIVENGTIKALKTGSAIITVTNEKGQSSTCKVKVEGNNPPGNVPSPEQSGNIPSPEQSGNVPSPEQSNEVESISFKETSKKIYIGDSYQTKIIVTPSNAEVTISYKSKNNKIATVSNDGKITAISEGKTQIIATHKKLTTTFNVTVLKNNNKTLTISFESNGADSISSQKETCNATSSGCQITLPTITRSAYKVLGWSRDKTATVAEYKPGEKITVYGDEIYYAITYKTVTANFNANGSVVAENKKTCTIYNTATSCNVKTPQITRTGYNIVGWGSSVSDTTAKEQVGKSISIKNDSNYYAITYKTVTANFDAGKAVISKDKASCSIYNQATSCVVETPTITRSNYTSVGWTSSKGSSNIIAYPKSNLYIATNATYYPITRIAVDGVEAGCTGWMAINGNYYSKATTSSTKSSIAVGTAFTIEGLDGSFFKVSIPNVSGYKYIQHKYVMINLSDYIPSMVFEITNATSSIFKSSGYSIDGVTGTKLYSTGKVYNERLGKEEYMAPILYTVAKKLLVAQRNFQSQGYSIKVYDVYRPHSVSTKVYSLFSKLYDSNEVVKENVKYSYGVSGKRYTWSKTWFISSGVSSHNTGSAIDMTLVNKNTGVEVTMPTVMHELSTKAIKYYSPDASKKPANYAKEMNDMAKLMDKVVTDTGLSSLASEWWHFLDTSANKLIKSKEAKGCDFSVTKVYSY